MSGIIITNANGKKSSLFLRLLSGSMNADEFIRFLKGLKRHLRGKKMLLFVDGLPAHRAKKVKDHIIQEKSWLRIERLPGYAPELNPIEYLWAAMKKKHLGNARAKGFGKLARMAKKAKRKMNDSKLLGGFLKASKLFG